MTKYPSTLLTQTNDPIEIGKADLDLLKKINNLVNETEGLTDGITERIDGLVDLTKDPTGFEYPIGIENTYNSTTRTITLRQSVSAYWRGTKIEELVPGWTSPPHPAGITESYFLYYDGTKFIWSTTPWTFDLLQIAYISADATGVKFGIRETHSTMGWRTHEEFHQTIGTYLLSGGDITNYTLNSTTLKFPYVTETVVKDEDLLTVNAAHATGNNYTNAYLTSTGLMTFTTGSATIVPVSGNQPYYNQFTGGSWQQTLVANNNYLTIWLIAVPVTADSGSQLYRYLWLQGQTSGALSGQQSLTPSDINVGNFLNLSPEFVFIGRLIIRYTASNWSITQVDKILGTRVNQVTGGTSLSISDVLNAVYPIGSYYTQYPDASSNTDSVEFPTSQTPAVLFGGTWVEQWSTESIFFRTRGTASDSGRTNGYQADAVQDHTHFMRYYSGTPAAGSEAYQLTALTTASNAVTLSMATGRSATETRTVNRRIKVWKRTA